MKQMDMELELLRLWNLTYTKGTTKTSLRAAINTLLMKVRPQDQQELFDGKR